MFRKTMSTSDAITLFDAGAGQVSVSWRMALAQRSYLPKIKRQSQGGRKHQEDRCTVIFPNQFPSNIEDKVAFFAIYDGQ